MQGDKKDSGGIKATTVLWYLVFTGFAVNYMIRINLNIAIVSMVKTKPKDNISLTSECIRTKKVLSNNTKNEFYNKELNDTVELFNNSNKLNSYLDDDDDESNKFDWHEKEQGHILGSFFWLHWLTQIPGGILAGKYGTKIVFGLSNFTGVLCCYLIPWMAHLGSKPLLLLRTFQGLLCGFAWPSMHHMVAKWIPPNERSNFLTSYLGSSVGAALTYPICGFIIDRWGWELAFYVSGILGTVWFAAWWLLVYDSPAEHPRISTYEKEYIITSLGQSVSKKQTNVPWMKIFTSLPVWTNILAQWGGVWGLFTLMTNAPTYFKFIHGWNIRATGLLSGMPHILRMVWAYIVSLLGDYLLKSNKMNRTNVRKLATTSCLIVQGIFMLALAYSGCDSLMAIIFLTAAVAMHGAVSTGPLASIVDISPNYASVVLGIVNTVVAVTGFLTPLLVGYLTFQNQTTPQWQKVFWVAALQLFVTGIFYILFSTSEIQSWNSPEDSSIPEKELMVIKETLNTGEENSKNGYASVKITETHKF